MTLNEMLNRVREILPNASVGEDNDGQIVIYTDKVIDSRENLVSIVESN